MFVGSIAASDAARQLLSVAGFKSSNADRNISKEGAGASGVGGAGDLLTLVHSNSAILTLIVQVIHRR